jgi:plastocyanin
LRLRTSIVLVVLTALAVPGTALAQAQRLIGVVGPGRTITLTDASGTPVTQLTAGTYQIDVDDRAPVHNFHLTGPGVDQRTDVAFVGQATWTVTLSAGTYTYVCDPHAGDMRGSFSVTAPAQQPPQQQPPATVRPGRLVGTVGPGFTITLRTAAGGAVRSARAGLYTIVVRDRSRMHNFHLVGPGVNRRTAVAFRGTVTWRVRLRRGATYRFVCDPHARGMRGSVRVR